MHGKAGCLTLNRHPAHHPAPSKEKGIHALCWLYRLNAGAGHPCPAVRKPPVLACVNSHAGGHRSRPPAPGTRMRSPVASMPLRGFISGRPCPAISKLPKRSAPRQASESHRSRAAEAATQASEPHRPPPRVHLDEHRQPPVKTLAASNTGSRTTAVRHQSDDLVGPSGTAANVRET